MEHINTVLYISSTPQSISEIYTEQLEKSLPIRFIRASNIQELFNSLSQLCSVDYISIDTEMLQSQSNRQLTLLHP